MRAQAVFIALSMTLSAWAQTPTILLEACNAIEPASKRLECLRAANGTSANRSSAEVGAKSGRPTAPQLLYVPSGNSNSSSKASAAPAPGTTYTVGGKTCYVGPRGGTYTITASGRKNYSGC